MKKFILITLVAIATLLCSCNKEAVTPEPEMVNVTFDYKMVESNSMVRSATDEQIITLIKSLLPSQLDVTLTDKVRGTQYTVTTGSSTVIPEGTYSVYFQNLESDFTSNAPFLKIDEDVVVTKDVTAYTLNAIYACFAVIVDIEEVIAVSYRDGAANKSTWSINDMRANNNFRYGIKFIRYVDTSTSTVSLCLKVASTSMFVETVVKMKESSEQGCIKGEYGKYYFLRPESVGKVTATSSVSYPDWIPGGSNI